MRAIGLAFAPVVQPAYRSRLRGIEGSAVTRVAGTGSSLLAGCAGLFGAAVGVHSTRPANACVSEPAPLVAFCSSDGISRSSTAALRDGRESERATTTPAERALQETTNTQRITS